MTISKKALQKLQAIVKRHIDSFGRSVSLVDELKIMRTTDAKKEQQ